jgi:hypothetical protein
MVILIKLQAGLEAICVGCKNLLCSEEDEPTAKATETGWLIPCPVCSSNVLFLRPEFEETLSSDEPEGEEDLCEECQKPLNNLLPGIFIIERGVAEKQVCGDCKDVLEPQGWSVTAQAKGID